MAPEDTEALVRYKVLAEIPSFNFTLYLFYCAMVSDAVSIYTTYKLLYGILYVMKNQVMLPFYPPISSRTTAVVLSNDITPIPSSAVRQAVAGRDE